MDLIYISVFLIFGIVHYQPCGADRRLFVGFVDYSNRDNRRADGQCCDGEVNADGHCRVSCDLIFQLSVMGLDGPNTVDRHPSDVPFNSTPPFQEPGKNIINPLAFPFHSWPSCLDILVEIFDLDKVSESERTLQPVDNMTLKISLGHPSILFTQFKLSGNRHIYPSNLTVVMRYECDDADDVMCKPGPWTEDENIQGCPTPSPPSTTITTTTTMPTTSTIQTTSTSTTQTSTTPCTTQTTSSTTQPTTETTRATTTSLPTTTTQATTVITKGTPVAVFLSTSSSTSSETSTASTLKSAEATTASEMVQPRTTREGSDDSGPMAYWAVILGAVLGALAVIAVIGFLVYYRRRQALYKRQELYQVTPRIMSVVEEDGTAGRGDIPVETTEEEYTRREIYTVTPRIVSVVEGNGKVNH